MYGVLRDPGWGDDKVDTRRLPVGEGWGGVVAAVIAAGGLVWIIEDFWRALTLVGLLGGLLLGISFGLSFLARRAPRVGEPLTLAIPGLVGLAVLGYGISQAAWWGTAFFAVILAPTIVLRTVMVVVYFRRPELFVDDGAAA